MSKARNARASKEVTLPTRQSPESYETGTLITEISRLPSKINGRRLSLGNARESTASTVVDDCFVLNLGKPES